jgi:hypothetical protein
LWGALAIHAAIALVSVARSSQPIYDFERYYEIAVSPGRPYVDFQVEYPPGTVLTLRALASSTGDRAAFGVGLVLLSIAADLTIVAALAWGWDIAAAACYALIVIPIIDLFFFRTDLWSAAFAAMAVAAWKRERRVVTGISLAVGAALKIWPLPFVAVLLIPARAGGRLRSITVGAAAGALFLVGWISTAGRTGFYQVLTARGAQGWEIESTIGSLWMLVSRSSMRVESGAWRIGTTIGPISVALALLAALLCFWCIWRGGQTGHLGAGWIGGVSTLLVLSAVLSPQYAAWLAPGCAIAWSDEDRRIAVLSALAILLTNLVWKSFNPLLHGAAGPMVMLLARNSLLVIVALDAARLMRVLPRIAAADPGQDAERS